MQEVKDKVSLGTHSGAFMRFYKSDAQCLRTEYDSTQSAKSAHSAMMNLMNRNHIYDVRIIRQKNVLRLLKPRAYQQTQEYRDRIMERFLRVN